MRALLSVADRDGIVELARALLELGVEVLARDGTREALEREGLAVRAAPHGASSPSLDDPGAGLASIDIVVANLAPFAPASASPPPSAASALEALDVGRVALLSAAAREHARVAVVSDPADYPALVDELRFDGAVSAGTRQRLAAAALASVAAHQAGIAAYLEHLAGLRFPEQLLVVLRKERDLPYGENPHQSAALYRETTRRRRSLADAEQLSGPSPTYNDLLDLDAAYRIASDFASPTTCIAKQRNPVGLASNDALAEAYRRALDGDAVSAYGAVVALNREVDADTARELILTAYEGVVAPGYSDEARALLATRQDLAVLLVPAAPAEGLPDYGISDLLFHRLEGGLLVETRDALDVDRARLDVVTARRPTLEELTDLLFAWRAVRHVTSNAVVLARGAMLVGIGAGQSSRLTATEIALHRAAERAPMSVLASDAYFPFGDAIALAAERGVTAIIQPGGSVRDAVAIEIADRHHLAMVFTGRRHYRR